MSGKRSQQKKKKTDQGMIILHPRSQWRGHLSKMSIVAFIGDFDFLFFFPCCQHCADILRSEKWSFIRSTVAWHCSLGYVWSTFFRTPCLGVVRPYLQELLWKVVAHSIPGKNTSARWGVFLTHEPASWTGLKFLLKLELLWHILIGK